MPGISSSKTAIPFNSVGFDESAYWTTLISATVETADPDEIVLTFPVAASLTDADFTVTVNAAAVAVSSASWTGGVLTLVLASAVAFGDVVVVTFVKTGDTETVSNYVAFTDSFDRADAALGNDWVYNGSWLVSTNKAVAAPSVTGSNLVTNGDFETGDPPTGWTAAASNTIAQDADARPGSAGTKSALITVGGSNYAVNRQVTTTKGRLYNLDLWGKRGTAATFGLSWQSLESYYNDVAWANKKMGVICTANVNSYFHVIATGTALIDDLVIKQLVTNEVYAVRDFAISNVDISVKVDLTGREAGGIILCVDDTTTPTDYILISIVPYGGSPTANTYYVTINKVVGGTHTEVVSFLYDHMARSYAVDKIFRVQKNGSTIKAYFNGVQICPDVQITDAGLISNTRHGIFSTGNTVNFNDFSCMPYVIGAISGSPWFTRVSQTDLYTTSGAKDWLGWPYLFEAPNGNWIMTYRAGTEHGDSDATAVCHIRFSDDEGATWTAEDTKLGGGAVTGFPMGIHVGSTSIGSGVYIPCPNGDILAHIYEWGSGTYQWRSSDNGETWTDEGIINTDNKIVAIDDYKIDGTDIYISVNYAFPLTDPWINRLYKSSDNGATWAALGVMETDGDEVGFVIAPNGDFVAIMRDPDVLTTYTYRSTDKGVTWGAKTEVPELGILQRPRMKLDGAGGIILHGREFPATNTKYPVIWYSDDNGVSWGRKFTPDVSAAADGAYNEYLIKTDGSYYMITYKGTTLAAKIRQLIFSKA